MKIDWIIYQGAWVAAAVLLVAPTRNAEAQYGPLYNSAQQPYYGQPTVTAGGYGDPAVNPSQVASRQQTPTPSLTTAPPNSTGTTGQFPPRTSNPYGYGSAPYGSPNYGRVATNENANQLPRLPLPPQQGPDTATPTPVVTPVPSTTPEPVAMPAETHPLSSGGAPAASNDWRGYTSSGAGCGCESQGSYGPAGYGAQSSCVSDGGYCNYGVSDCYEPGPRRQWFAGIYALGMTRDNPGKATVAVLVDGAPAGNYYPQSTDLFLISSQADVDWQVGGEVRFGSTFGAVADTCGCPGSQPFAWEVAYWGLDEDSSQAVVSDTFGGTTRMYGMMNYAGIEYDRDGAGVGGYRPVNDYYDYQTPIDSTSTNNVRVLANRVRQTFEMQNLELNFWRFGSPGAGTVAACSGYGQGACSQDSCGYGAATCDPCECQPVVRPSRFSISGLVGVRYVKLDETFQNATFFTLDDGAGGLVGGEPPSYPNGMPTDDDNVLFHDVEVDNRLVGFQVGCNMSSAISCRWTLFCDSNFGIYGNDIDTYQRVYSGGGGNVRFVGTGANAAIRSSKEDVAFLGELRCGLSYQFSERCRLMGAYRVIGMTGVALAVEQIETPINEAAWTPDTNDSLVLHGAQLGVEIKY